MQTTDPLESLCALDVEYARFNAEKTMADAGPSAFAAKELGPLTVTTDTLREGTYYNRILGLTSASVDWLDRGLEAFTDRAPCPRIDVDRAEHQLAFALRTRGFNPRYGLLWFAAETSPQTVSAPVRRLDSVEADAILPILEAQVPVDPEVWAARRHFHATDRFRTFVIEAEGEVAAMATTYVGEHGAILGNAFTLEAHRGRGYQSALIAARVADAHALGLGWVVTDVEPDTTSHRNCERAGFSCILDQQIWERKETT